jgi:hypothetical protein
LYLANPGGNNQRRKGGMPEEKAFAISFDVEI